MLYHRTAHPYQRKGIKDLRGWNEAVSGEVSWFERQVSNKEGRNFPWNRKCDPLPSELL